MKRVLKIALSCLLAFSTIQADVVSEEEVHDINFKQVPVSEFIRFVSKISHVNFIFNNKDLQFNVSFSSGKPVSCEHVLQALIQLLRVHGFSVAKEENYYVVHKMDEQAANSDGVFTKDAAIPASPFLKENEKQQFSVFKLQYHQGNEIQESLKKIAGDLKNQPATSPKLLDAIQSMQWIKATNSLLFSCDEQTVDSLKSLVSSLDVPLRQVFIEVLVIETDVRKSMDFGLQWGAGGKYKNHMSGGVGSFPRSSGDAPAIFSGTLQGLSGASPGLGQIPVGSGFDLGIIGDIIMHKGASYLTLGALVSAIQGDSDSSIVLNQKIITQDNKKSTIFVGDNIPFPGSVVQTVGNGQQTTSNIEYRDIGVSLNITPMLGEGDIITLDLDQEISEAINTPTPRGHNAVNGIRSTKTNMVTHVHVPDKHFLVLSGMVRNTKAKHKTGLPCLGSLPLIGALFSKTEKDDEKRNIIIFVRPHIIHTFEDYAKVTQRQEELLKVQGNAADVEAGLQLLREKQD